MSWLVVQPLLCKILWKPIKATGRIEHLAGGIPTPLKNMKVSWDHCSILFPRYRKIKHVPNHKAEKTHMGTEYQKTRITLDVLLDINKY